MLALSDKHFKATIIKLLRRIITHIPEINACTKSPGKETEDTMKK